jgi:6,7-dimethyl-8-ribityllumazine synthase
MQQAMARSGGDERDQGRRSAEVVLRMTQLRSRLASG